MLYRLGIVVHIVHESEICPSVLQHISSTLFKYRLSGCSGSYSFSTPFPQPVAQH